MEKIVELLNNFDNLGKFVPELDKVMDLVQKLTSLAVRVGPLCILVLGLIYLLIPPKEANYKAGYRTFFGMGSLGAWHFTQFVSGVIMTLIGLILNFKAAHTAKSFAGMDPDAMIDAAFSTIKGQVICAIVIYVFMFVVTAVMFTVKGQLRIKSLRGTLLEKVLFDEHPQRLLLQAFGVKDSRPRRRSPRVKPEIAAEEPVETQEEEPQPEFERQGEQVITADDIVIEGL